MKSTMYPHAMWGVCVAIALTVAACGGGSGEGQDTQNASVAATIRSAELSTKAASDQPGVVVKPVSATSSAVENPGMSAAAAIDGNPNSRCSSR